MQCVLNWSNVFGINIGYIVKLLTTALPFIVISLIAARCYL